ncbi:hypothetical protein MJO52_08420 [Microbulbifer variabilis]|uniref:Uncharacterized protein n=1 Tax=Microbulbifer variabilis TaxID=266805 RepID=A0ABY4VFX1_9GAMM|nr:hypothetical protein [Microbulbifer variabilis]USD23146.1 hypothetical protein MJO52_08420 [Microbulbifer variabilis]
MRKIIPLIALLCAGGYFFWAKSHTDSPQPITEKPVSPPSKKIVPTETKSTEEVVVMPSAQEQEANPDSALMWAESDVARQVLHESGRLPLDLNGETYLEIDVEALKNLSIGDYVDIEMPGVKGNYDAQVDKVQEHASGNKSVQMNLPGYGSVYFVNFTIGKNSVYGNLTLPSGSYSLEAQGNYAWVASKKDLTRSHLEEEVKLK